MAIVVEGVELKACPFCGKGADLKSTGIDSWGKTRFWAKCSNKKCGISTMATEDQDQAVALWNGRSK